MGHHKKNHGRCKSRGERDERKTHLFAHTGSVWKDNVLVNESTGEPIPGVPSGEEIRKKHEPAWKKGRPGKGHNRAKRRRKAEDRQREAESHRRKKNNEDRDYSSGRRRSQSGSIWTPGW